MGARIFAEEIIIRTSRGFTLLEWLVVIAKLRHLGQQIQVCAVGDDFGVTGGWPSDGGVSRPPVGCDDIAWPDSAHNSFGSTFDDSNATYMRGVPVGKRWAGITFWCKENLSLGRMNFGPGLARWESGGNVAYSYALKSP